MRCLRDSKVQRRVGKPRRVAVRSIDIGLNRCLHYGDVALRAPCGCRAGNHRLDQPARIENVLELAPVRDELAAHMMGRVRPPVDEHEISAVPPAPDFEVASVGELLKCVADRCARYAEHGGKFAFGRQLLAIDVDAKAKSRDEPIHDVVGDITRLDRPPEGRRHGAR